MQNCKSSLKISRYHYISHLGSIQSPGNILSGAWFYTSVNCHPYLRLGRVIQMTGVVFVNGCFHCFRSSRFLSQIQTHLPSSKDETQCIYDDCCNATNAAPPTHSSRFFQKKMSCHYVRLSDLCQSRLCFSECVSCSAAFCGLG